MDCSRLAERRLGMIAHRVFATAIFLISHFSAHGLGQFMHCRTAWEEGKMSEYTFDDRGRSALFADMPNFIELKIGNGFIIPYGSSGSLLSMESTVVKAISTILGTKTGMDLFGTLITKLTLRREAFFYMYNALDRYNQNMQKNCLSAAMGALYRMARARVGSRGVTTVDLNGVIKLLSTVDGFKGVFDGVLLESGWEERCCELFAIPAPTKDPGDADDEDHRLLVDAEIALADLGPIAEPYKISTKAIELLGWYFNTTKVRITNEQMSGGHCCYLASDGASTINIHLPGIKGTEVYALPNKAASVGDTGVTRIFQLLGKQDQTRDFPILNLNRRLVADMEEVLFHEGGHCLHGIENRDDVRGQYDGIEITYSWLFGGDNMTTDISADLITDWFNPEELRNGTGVVIMKDGTLQVDMICTYRYDRDRGREPRWPYRDVTTTPGTTVGDFVEFVRTLHN